MNAPVTQPALERRLIAPRRSPAFFSAQITQHVQRLCWPLELVRAAAALAGVAAWGLIVLLLAA